MAEIEAQGLSLWLMPEGHVRERLRARIEQLAGRFGTACFLPHLTLAQGLVLKEAQACAAAARSAAAIEPFVVTLGAAEGRDEHFRCLFLRAQADSALQAAHAAAARAFGREPDPAFLPHVSLVYGTLAPDQKQAIARELADTLCLRFEALRLHLWRTAGPVAEWREIAVFALR